METISGHTNLCIGVFSSGSCHTVLWRIAQGTHENATTKLNPHKILTRFALMGYKIYWRWNSEDVTHRFLSSIVLMQVMKSLRGRDDAKLLSV
jgi:hypothetical protein